MAALQGVEIDDIRTNNVRIRLYFKTVFHFNRIEAKRSVSYCVLVISSA